MLVCSMPLVAIAADPPAVPAKPAFDLRHPAVLSIVRKAAVEQEAPKSTPADPPAAREDAIPATLTAQKLAQTPLPRPTAPAAQRSTCVPVAAASGKGPQQQHAGIASDPLQSWVAAQLGGSSWPCSTVDAAMPSPWAK